MALSKSEPASLAGTISAVEAALWACDLAKAMQLSEDAVAAGAQHPTLLSLAALKLMHAGQNRQALPLLEQARQSLPRHVDLLNALGTCLSRLGRPREAVEAFDAAIAVAPEARLHFGRGLALEDLSELEKARQDFEQALALDPALSEALARLAVIAIQRGDGLAARQLATRALAINPREAAARLALTQAALEQKDIAGAEEALAPLVQDPALGAVNRAFAMSLAGDILDAQQRPLEAFAAYTNSKAILRGFYAPNLAGMEGVLARELRLAHYFRRTDLAVWQTGVQAQQNPITHVFLIGFPRSGTTLLEQVLASHPDVAAMEERTCLMDSAAAFFGSDADLDRLGAATDAQLQPWRASYWRRVSESGIAALKPVFIDKMPLNAVFLPLIAKLFPQARILLALRDPRDVALSCFRRRFAMNAGMFEFTTLEGTAAYYAAVMDLVQIFRETLTLRLLEVRHENLVSDFDGEVARVCDFLGLEPRAEMSGFATHAKAQAIDTPSGAQLAGGLSSAGIAQWRRYRRELEPVFPVLEPFVARFGYPEK
jgi:tetratricopeptide (TPR) repeat protein